MIHRAYFAIISGTLIVFLSACNFMSLLQPTATAIPPTPTPLPPTELTICLAYEPQSLYPYGLTSQVARDVLQAIYDGPIDTIDGKAQPIILEKLPAFQDGSASLTPVSVQAGDTVVNTYGELVSLQAGTQIFPSGCSTPACALTWDGSAPLQLDQPSADFRLLPGLTWSDGQPLLASDSVYSFELAADADTPVSKTRVNQTAEYSALDERTVHWVGKPGLVTDSLQEFFWMPLPQHAWGSYSAAQLLEAEESTRRPLGWGAYVLEEWQPGEYMRLKKNPGYFRAAEGLPKFDHVIFKFTDPYGDTNMANLKFNRAPFDQFRYDVGEFEKQVEQSGCDLISSSIDMNDQLEVLHILQIYYQDPAVRIMPGPAKEAEWLLFNQTPTQADQLSFFQDINLRRAVTQCVDRESLVEEIFYDLYQVPKEISFSTTGSQHANLSLIFDPANAQDSLTDMGWLDENPNDDYPRVAQGVNGVLDGSQLALKYLVKDDDFSLAVANHVKQDLLKCGIQINLIKVPTEVFWDSSQKHSVFNGDFHLAQLSWMLPLENPCLLFANESYLHLNDLDTNLNFMGFDHREVNAICSSLNATHLAADRLTKIEQLQTILNQEIALVPLYEKPSLMVARNDFCQEQIPNGEQSELVHIEQFDYQPACLP